MEYISISQAAEKWGISPRRIQVPASSSGSPAHPVWLQLRRDIGADCSREAGIKVAIKP